jgi:lipopolysaccharide export system protein LptC
MLEKRNLAISGFLLFLIALSTWLLFSSYQQSGTNKPQNPDSFMTNVHIIQMDKHGKPHYELITPKTVSYLLNDSSVLATPFIITYSQDEPPWHIKAKHGKTLHGFDKAFLWDNVSFHQLPGHGSHNATLKTSEMTFYPHKSFAETAKPVTIIQPGSIIHGIGMQADFNKNYLKLLSQTHGQYMTEEKNSSKKAQTPNDKNS